MKNACWGDIFEQTLPEASLAGHGRDNDRFGKMVMKAAAGHPNGSGGSNPHRGMGAPAPINILFAFFMGNARETAGFAPEV